MPFKECDICATFTDCEFITDLCGHRQIHVCYACLKRCTRRNAPKSLA